MNIEIFLRLRRLYSIFDLIGQGADWSNMKLYDDNSGLVPEAEPYTPSSTLRKLNHPLMIMVKEERAVRDHSLIMSDIRGVWGVKQN